MSLQDEFDEQRRDLEEGYKEDENIVKSMTPWLFRNTFGRPDRSFNRKGEVTADTIRQEAEQPIEDLLQTGAALTKTGASFYMSDMLNKQLSRNRQFPFRTGEGIVNVKPKTNKISIWDRMFNQVPTSESKVQEIQKARINNRISVSEATRIVDNNFKNNLVNPVKNYADSAAYLFGGGLGTGTGVPSNTFSGDSINPVDPIQARNMMKRAIENNLTQGGSAARLNYKALLNNKTFRQAYARLVAGDIATPPEKGLATSRRTQNINRQQAWETLRTQKLELFNDLYGPALVELGIDSSQIDLDHKLTLVQSLGMLHNTNPGDPLWLRIQTVALRRGYVAGDAEQNLDLVVPEVHRLKTNFFNDLHGLGDKYNNMKYWNGQHRNLVDANGKPITRFQIMDNSHKSKKAADLHVQVVEDYFNQVDRGKDILDTAQAIWKTNYKTNILPEEVAHQLFNVIIDTDKKYTPQMLLDIINDIVTNEKQRGTQGFSELERAVSNQAEIDDYASSVRQVQQDTDPEDLPKPRRVQSQKKKKEKNIKINDEDDTQLHL